MHTVFKGATAIIFTLLAGICVSSVQSKTLYENQRDFIDLRFGMFLHFSMNTFVAGYAMDRIDPKSFNPTQLNCSQWARAAKAAGMKFGVLTTKHHDGFSVWPSKQIPPNGKPLYTVAQSSTPKRDVVKEFCDAFRAEGLLPGLYFSMWDVANGVGVGEDWKTSSRAFVMGQLTELLTNYGEIPIIFFDGWAWEKAFSFWKIPYGEIRDTIKTLQPNCLVVVNDGITSPWQEDVIWWEEPKKLYVPPGNIYPSIQGPSIGPIAPQWFWNTQYLNPKTIRSLADLLDHLAKMEPRYCNFLLNCPPNRQGLLDSAVVYRLAEVGKAWKPNSARPPLPRQMVNIEHVLAPKDVTASSNTALAIQAADGVCDLAGNGSDANGMPIIAPRRQTLWQSASGLPQWVQLDLGAIDSVNIFGYLPRQETKSFAGSITDYTIQVSSDNKVFTDVATGKWDGKNKNYRTVTFPTARVRYIRLVARGAVDSLGNAGAAFAAVSELNTGRYIQGETKIRTAFQFPGHTAMEILEGPGPSGIMVVTGSRFTLPPVYRGTKNAVSLYDLSGKIVRTIITDKNVIDLSSEIGLSAAVFLARVSPVR